MKKITLFLLALLCFSLNAYSYGAASTDEDITQVTLQGVTTKQPRDGSIIPLVSCYYFNGLLHVDCYADVEMIQVSVTNTANGEMHDAFGDGSSQSLELFVSSESGTYYVEIIMDSTVLYGYYFI